VRRDQQSDGNEKEDGAQIHLDEEVEMRCPPEEHGQKIGKEDP
jgi:hypothetical protein